MGFYTVEGADAQSGQDRVIKLLAENEEDAAKQAKESGLLVSGIYPATEPNEGVPKLGAVRAAQRTFPPQYLGLKIAASINGVVAALFYLGGALIIVLAFLNGSGAGMDQSDWLSGAMGRLLVGLAIMAGGGIYHGISAGCLALRDVARNSF